jgi:hypothetical protein
MDRSCVVTGASTGIGRAIARRLIAGGWHVFGSVRREADAAALRAEFCDKATPLVFDVTDEAAVQAGAAKVARALGPKARLGGLVNNAGIAVSGPMLHVPLADLRHQLEVNVVAQVSVTQAFAPLLGSDRTRVGEPGRIVNISSIAGRLTPPFLGPYAASKHAMEAITDAFRRELRIYGIDVIAIQPGSVATPIWDKAEGGDYSALMRTDYAPSAKKLMDLMISDGRKGYKPEVIGEAAFTALTAAKPPARIAPVPGRLKNWTLPRLLPDRALDAVMGAMFGLKRL